MESKAKQSKSKQSKDVANASHFLPSDQKYIIATLKNQNKIFKTAISLCRETELKRGKKMLPKSVAAGVYYEFCKTYLRFRMCDFR